MAHVKLDPLLADPFVRMNAEDASRSAHDFSRELVDAYEAGRVILLEDAPFHPDIELLSRFRLPAEPRFKKLSDTFFLRPALHRREVRRAFREMFSSWSDYFAFRREVARLRREIRKFIFQSFSGYRFSKENISWRFTPSGGEHMHLDFFHSGEDIQYVRMFINVDVQPRLWNVSASLMELADRFYETAALGRFRDRSADALIECLTKIVFGWKDNPGDDRQPRHEVVLEPGDVWLCDSRKVSHQLVRGNRLVSAKFRALPSSMRDPTLRVEAQLARLHRSRGAGGA